MYRGFFRRLLVGLTLAAVPGFVHAAPVDPLTVTIERRDADRFAAIFAAHNGLPPAATLQSDYLDGAGPGVAIFTPYRIENAENLARAIAAESARYRYAIETCLPLLDGLTGEMRAIYLAYAGLVPNRPLPAVHVVFGAATSGGTASPTAQVLGLEVMCGPGTTPAQFQTAMRGMFAHETVHSWQTTKVSEKAMADPLLFYALREGVPDYLASLVTGEIPNAARDRWAREKGDWLWREFDRDRQIVRAGRIGKGDFNAAGRTAVRRWIGNFGSEPEGWPTEAGYWIGMTIAAAYVERAPDRRKAIDELIALDDPLAILTASGIAMAKSE
jgi:hypothetical protein